MSLLIDGSQGEGGGQVLRTALALSAISGRAIRVVNIRAGRQKPGLAPQHLAGVLAAAEICGADVRGAKLRSMDVTFAPAAATKSGSYAFDVSRMSGQGSAGAVTLLLQSILLPLALADGSSTLTLRGGTHVAWSPPAHYLELVFLPTLARIGSLATLRLGEWGWYPQGGGEMIVRVVGGASLRGVDLTQRGDLVAIEGIAAVSNLPSHIPQRIAARANNLLREAGLPPRVQPARLGGPSTGAGIFMAARYQNTLAGFSALGERGKPSEVVAGEAVDELLAYHQGQAALDPHLPDQIIPALALAQGPSALTTVEITRHTLTNIEVIRQFVEREIVVEGQEGTPGTIRVLGDGPVWKT